MLLEPTPTDEVNEKYREKAYPEWLDRCEQILGHHHWALQDQAASPHLSFLAESVGTSPATDALVTIEAQGHFPIQPLSSNDEDEEQDGEDDELKNRKAEQLPRPPSAPRGQWKRTMAEHPRVALRAMDAIRRSLHGYSTLATATAHTDDSWLRPLNVRPRSRDPIAFDKKLPGILAGASCSLSCDQWRHDDGETLFDGDIHLPVKC